MPGRRKFLQGRNNGDTIAAKDGRSPSSRSNLVSSILSAGVTYQRVGRCQIMPE